MAFTIAISGKGGSGKTTLAAMIIRIFLERSRKGVLAVDADPNSCLALTMGVEVTSTISQIREQSRQKQPSNGGMERGRAFEYGVQQAITEAKGFDLLAMGQPEGPSCYCAANNMLRGFMDKLNAQYDFVVIDNEAGMEHLSRRTTNNVDVLFIVAQPSPIGMVTAERIYGLTETLPIVVKKTGIIWNRHDQIKQVDGIESFGFVPYDQVLLDASMEGKTIFDIEMDTPAFSALRKMLNDKINFINK